MQKLDMISKQTHAQCIYLPRLLIAGSIIFTSTIVTHHLQSQLPTLSAHSL